MLTNKDYCDYDTCVALKELGFKQLVDWYFNEGKNIVPLHARYRNTFVPRIILYEAQKFLREKKGIFVYIDVPWKTNDGLGWSYFCCNKPMTEEDKEVCFASGGFYDSYEEALSEGVKCAVKLLKEK